VQIEIRDVPAPATHNPVVAVEKELLPLSFHVEAGAYINAIRSSLDILAMVLVERNGKRLREDRVFFPIARSIGEFQKSNSAISKVLDALAPADRKTIEQLQPYNGGNAALWALHHLDIVRKHRRLLEVGIRPLHISLAGTLGPDDFAALATGSMQVNDATVIGLLRKGVSETAVRSVFHVAMNEEGYTARKPVTATLAHLADVASNVIRVFDRQ
jgi:hypothetical protein